MQFSESRKERLYLEIEKLLRAGFSIDAAAAALLERHQSVPARQYLADLRQGMDSGKSIGESVAAVKVDLSPLETSMIAAAEKGGKIEEAYGHLAEYFGLINRTRKQIRASLIYPIVLLHFAVVLPNIPKAILAGDPGLAIRSIVGTLAVLYGIVAIIYFGGITLSRRAREDERLDRYFKAIPFLGKARISLSLNRFCQVFRLHLLAAFPVTTSILAAGEASQSGILKAAGRRAAERIDDGSSLAEAIGEEAGFPIDLISSLSTAEFSGTLDVDLERWQRLYRDTAINSFDAAGGWIPKIVYGLVVLYVVWQIFEMGFGYIGALEGYLDT